MERARIANRTTRAAGGLYHRCEKHWGMSRHAHALLKALRGQLDGATEDLLIEALKKEALPMERRRELITEERDPRVQSAGVDLLHWVCNERRQPDIDENEYREFWWVDEDGRRKAHGFFYQNRWSLEVLGSWQFKDGIAQRLIESCSKRRLITKEGVQEIE